MATLVLGSKGFIGTNLLSSVAGSTYIGLDKSDIDLTQAHGTSYLVQFIQNNNIDSLILLSAIKRQDGDGATIKVANDQIVEQVVHAIADTGISLLYFSSCAVYGEKNQQNNVTECSPLSPTSFYGEHKIWAESFIEEHLPRSSFLVLRPPLIYSASQSNGYHPGGFIASALSCGSIELWGDGCELREFLDISDVIRSIHLLRDRRITGFLNLVSGHSHSFSDCASHVVDHLPETVVLNRVRSNPKVDHTYDNSNLISAIGSFSFIPPSTVIKRYFAVA